jgi:hypothetical protein
MSWISLRSSGWVVWEWAGSDTFCKECEDILSREGEGLKRCSPTLPLRLLLLLLQGGRSLCVMGRVSVGWAVSSRLLLLLLLLLLLVELGAFASLVKVLTGREGARLNELRSKEAICVESIIYVGRCIGGGRGGGEGGENRSSEERRLQASMQRGGKEKAKRRAKARGVSE